jgi:hypothetical protein
MKSNYDFIYFIVITNYFIIYVHSSHTGYRIINIFECLYLSIISPFITIFPKQNLKYYPTLKERHLKRVLNDKKAETEMGEPNGQTSLLDADNF